MHSRRAAAALLGPRRSSDAATGAVAGADAHGSGAPEHVLAGGKMSSAVLRRSLLSTIVVSMRAVPRAFLMRRRFFLGPTDPITRGRLRRARSPGR